MARLQLRRYIWLIDMVRSAGSIGITYEEINSKWHRARGNPTMKAKFDEARQSRQLDTEGPEVQES